MATGKSQAVSVRVEPHIKAALQMAASNDHRSVASMVEVMVIRYCADNGIQIEDVEKGALSGDE